MRRNLIPAPFAIALLATFLSVPVSPAEFPSRVARVVLYPDMVEVTRLGEVDRPETTVVLSGLTPNLLPDTLSARVASGGARITGGAAEDLFRTQAGGEGGRGRAGGGNRGPAGGEGGSAGGRGSPRPLQGSAGSGCPRDLCPGGGDEGR